MGYVCEEGHTGTLSIKDPSMFSLHYALGIHLPTVLGNSQQADQGSRKVRGPGCIALEKGAGKVGAVGQHGSTVGLGTSRLETRLRGSSG